MRYALKDSKGNVVNILVLEKDAIYIPENGFSIEIYEDDKHKNKWEENRAKLYFQEYTIKIK